MNCAANWPFDEGIGFYKRLPLETLAFESLYFDLSILYSLAYQIISYNRSLVFSFVRNTTMGPTTWRISARAKFSAW